MGSLLVGDSYGADAARILIYDEDANRPRPLTCGQPLFDRDALVQRPLIGSRAQLESEGAASGLRVLRGVIAINDEDIELVSPEAV